MEEDEKSLNTNEHSPVQWLAALKKTLKEFNTGKLPKFEIKVRAELKDGKKLEVTKTFEHSSNTRCSAPPRYDRAVSPRRETKPLYEELRAQFSALKPQPSSYSDFLSAVRQRLRVFLGACHFVAAAFNQQPLVALGQHLVVEMTGGNDAVHVSNFEGR